MSRLSQIISQLKTSQIQQLWQCQILLKLELLSQVGNRNQTSSDYQQLQIYMRSQCIKPKQFWFKRMNQFIKVVYEKRNQALKIIYRILPIMIMRYIQINYVKYQGLEQCLINIYNLQFRGYNEAQIQKSELSKDLTIRNLYEIHLGKQMLQPKTQALQPITEITNSSRNNMRSLLFYLVYRQAGKYNQQTLIDYYRTLFIYCGADENELTKMGSLYLSQKTNNVSIFRYSITQQQLQWIILTLYELCTQVKKDKFQLLAVINVIHKKVSNQSLFRMSDVANSLIHLLEDQYSQVFV